MVNGRTERKSHWEQVYSHKSPLHVSWYQAEPKLSLQLIESAGFSKEAAVIDVGGGTSVLVDRLLDHRYCNLTVLDISSEALKFSKKRLEERSTNIQWIEADATEFDPDIPYDIWHDRAVFHFLTNAGDRRKYVSALNRSLCKNGHLIIATFAIGGPQKCSGLDVVQYDADKISSELGTGFKLQSEQFETHVTPSGRDQKFNFFHFIRQ